MQERVTTQPLRCSAIGVVPRQMVRFSGRVGQERAPAGPLKPEEESAMAPLFFVTKIICNLIIISKFAKILYLFW